MSEIIKIPLITQKIINSFLVIFLNVTAQRNRSRMALKKGRWDKRYNNNGTE